MLLFYDTETTGLWKNGLQLDHPDQPKPVQISALLVTYGGTITEKLDAYIRPDGWEITPDSTQHHGVTHQFALDNGRQLIDVLRDFNGLVKYADRMVGHNESFDFKIVQHALKLVKRKIEFPTAHSCTMIMATPVVRLPPNRPGGDFRWPSLEATYEFLFGKKLEGAHNSFVDVQACMEVYRALKNRGVDDQKPVQDKTQMRASDWSGYGRSYQRLQEIITTAQDNAGLLSEWESSFIDDLAKKVEKYEDRTLLSEKQWKILERIDNKLL